IIQTMKRILLIVATVCFALGACTPDKRQQTANEPNMIGKKNFESTDGLMTPETLWCFGRIGEVKISPDGKSLAYTVTWCDVEQNKSNTEIYLMNADGSDKKQLTRTAEREHCLQWRPDGQWLGFMRGSSIFEIKPDGSTERKVELKSEASEPEVSEFNYSPTGDKVLIVMETAIEKTFGNELYPDLPKANAYIYDDLMYRHWDTWEDGKYSHLYIAEYSDGNISAPEDIMPGEPWDAPTKPFDDLGETSWSPDGKILAYSCKKSKGKEYAETTNSNIYLYRIDTKQTEILTEGMYGYDKQPLFSPDGTKLLWLSMERAGYEADKQRIFIYDFATENKSDYSKDFDSNPSSIEWTKDGKSLYLTACFVETFRVFRMDLPEIKVESGVDMKKFVAPSATFTQISKDGFYDYQKVGQVEGGLIAVRSQITRPSEIWKLNIEAGEGEELSFVNKDILDKLDLPEMTQRMVKTTDDKMMPVWVILPPKMDKSKKYPVIMMCTGGPQGEVSQSYSYRWNYALMASRGYVVVYPARRGASGYGQAWSDAVSKDHGGQPERDLISAIDDIAREPWVDPQRLGAVGASYGGFSVFWLAGNHNKRFKTFIAHCGIFDMPSMYMTTEEMFFENWEKGGPFWDKNNAVIQKSFAQSPSNFVNSWDTPILVSHGARDYRVAYSQGMAAFNVARLKGIPARLVIFPEENHWVLRPQNAILWQREFFAWMDKYLKN
ncbi:MAG: S9 family peptidase, partial [Prevotellaceae bacterium]|nr:S9 family peptidase [Prevotellaceae bacterium]